MLLKIRGVTLCKKCGDFAPSNDKSDKILPVSNILYKEKKTNQPTPVLVPKLSSRNNTEQTSFNEDGSNEEFEQGVYNTLTLRATGYVESETWTRHPVIDCHTDASFNASNTKYLSDSFNSSELASDDGSYKEYSSIYLQNNETRDKTLQDLQYVEPENREKISISSYPDDVFNYDEPVQVHNRELNSNDMLMKELSYQLKNLAKN
ncbi:uncharacterized protein LOC134270696 [Saccostrea cucullata]|uniref:uncharacterized protein LOC134270696 n=1 Tax=Saccostrea cuccullata TaxID=36930 RepID=UPI002ED0E2AE